MGWAIGRSACYSTGTLATVPCDAAIGIGAALTFLLNGFAVGFGYAVLCGGLRL